MKVFVIAFLLGVVMASGSAFAATSYYWTEKGTSYKCEGYEAGVHCRETNYYRSQQYGISIIPTLITVTYGGKVIYGCARKKRPAYNCASYVPAP